MLLVVLVGVCVLGMVLWVVALVALAQVASAADAHIDDDQVRVLSYSPDGEPVWLVVAPRVELVQDHRPSALLLEDKGDGR